MERASLNCTNSTKTEDCILLAPSTALWRLEEELASASPDPVAAQWEAFLAVRNELREQTSLNNIALHTRANPSDARLWSCRNALNYTRLFLTERWQIELRHFGAFGNRRHLVW